MFLCDTGVSWLNTKNWSRILLWRLLQHSSFVLDMGHLVSPMEWETSLEAGYWTWKFFSSCFARYSHASTYSWLLLFFSCEVCCVVSCVKCLDVCQRHSADLLQLDNGIKVPPSGWKCEKCDLRENLWLNLTDGAILCGRRNFDGSGGNNHAVEHYQVTSYPLAVKLGTITPDGAGEVVLLA